MLVLRNTTQKKGGGNQNIKTIWQKLKPLALLQNKLRNQNQILKKVNCSSVDILGFKRNRKEPHEIYHSLGRMSSTRYIAFLGHMTRWCLF